MTFSDQFREEISKRSGWGKHGKALFPIFADVVCGAGRCDPVLFTFGQRHIESRWAIIHT